MKFFTLIHICENEQSLHNNSFVRTFEEQVDLYFSCAAQLFESLKSSGIELIIITNNKDFLLRLNRGKSDIQIIQLNFALNVPSGVKFYSAHFKIEIYKYFSSLQEDYIGLIDCDIVCVNKIPESFKNIIRHKVPLYYDITDQVVPAFSERRIISDKERLSKTKSFGLWAGGEFITGTPEFFGKLYEEIETFKEDYFNDFNSFQHQGDEMLTSVAIENLIMKSGVSVVDAGSLSIIGRFWSYEPLHVQKSINAYTDHFLLHLPSDKKFIVSNSPKKLKRKQFFKSYKQHLFISRAIESTFKGIKPYVKRVRKKLVK